MKKIVLGMSTALLLAGCAGDVIPSYSIHYTKLYDLHQGIRFLATPSTCIQFMPLSRDFSLDVAGPGWRYLQLHPDGRLATQVWRLPAGSFIPDAQATGY